MRNVIREVTAGRVDLQYENVIRFNYTECPAQNGDRITEEEWRKVHDRFSEPQYILAIQPVTGLQSCLERVASQFSIHLVTARLAKARIATVQWLEQHCPNIRFDLHFLSHGEKHLVLGQFVAAVEDDLAQARNFAARGIKSYVIAKPWNVFSNLESENLVRLNSLTEVAEILTLPMNN